MSEYWDNYEPFDQEIESLKDTLRDSVNEETKALIASLRTDNADLKARLSNLDNLTREAERAKWEAEQAKTNAAHDAKNEARKMRLDELLAALDEHLYRVIQAGVERPKCDKCDEDRKLHYVTPRGRKSTEWCECSERDYCWTGEEQVGHQVYTRHGKWVVLWYDVRALDDRYGDYMDAHFLKPAELATPEDLKASPRGYGFHNKDDAQALADLLNTNDKKEGRND